MNITFADNKLRKYANDSRLAVRKLGTLRAKLYKRRLEDMADAGSFAELKELPGNYHQLTENKKDQWACDLDQPYRLVFEPGETPIPKDMHGNQILIEIKSLEILEIDNYHKEK
jgi:proteic killer suppression protein